MYEVESLNFRKPEIVIESMIVQSPYHHSKEETPSRKLILIIQPNGYYILRLCQNDLHLHYRANAMGFYKNEGHDFTSETASFYRLFVFWNADKGNF